MAEQKREFQVRFERKPNQSFMQTRIHFERRDKLHLENNSGLLHKTYNLRTRFVGDAPSLTKKLNSFTPTSTKGKVALTVAKTTYKAGKLAGYAAIKTGLAAETTAIGIGKLTFTDKQMRLKFTRVQNSNGKFVTKPSFYIGEKTYQEKQHGLLHAAVNLKSRIDGDAPSLTKKLYNFTPTTDTGKSFHKLAKNTYRITSVTGKTALKAGLAAETAGFNAARFVKQQGISSFRQKYQQNAGDDVHQGALKTVGVALSAASGLRTHFQQKKQFKSEKAKFLERKSDFKLHKPKQKLQISQKKTDLKTLKQNHAARMKNFKAANKSGKSNIRTALKKRRTQQLKADKKILKTDKAAIVFKKKSEKKLLKNQKKIKKLSRSGFLAFKPVKAGIKNLKSAGWRKAAYADDSNDFMKASDKLLSTAKSMKKTKSQKLNAAMKKRSKLLKKENNRSGKLKARSTKLQDKKKQLNKKRAYKKKRRNHSGGFSGAMQAIGKVFSSPASIKKAAASLAGKFVLGTFIPILPFILILALFMNFIATVSSNSGFVLGTYAAIDDSLSAAVEHYTKLAYNMNESVKKCGKSDTWEDGLQELGIDTDDYDDEPDEFVFGKSTVLNYTPAYDFDPYILWSFLCAYYYEFDEENEDIEYWTYERDGENAYNNNTTDDVVKKLFNQEYKFEHYYDNESHWVQRDDYDFSDGWTRTYGSGCVTNSYGLFGYIDFNSVPSSLQSYASGNRVYYSFENGEIKNANDEYSATGWYFQDMRSTVTDPSGTVSKGLYQQNYGLYSTTYSDGYGFFANGVWFPMSRWSVTLSDGTESQKKYCAEAAPRDVVIYKYSYSDVPINDFGTTMETEWINTLKYGYGISTLETETVAEKNTEYWDRDGFYEQILDDAQEYDTYNNYGWCKYYHMYDWNTDCTLYYNVKQKRTMQEAAKVILQDMDDADQRLEYFYLLIGDEEGSDPMYGNHQTLKSPVGISMKELITSGKILNGYGWDMQEWNKTHCDLTECHYALDIAYEKRNPVYAMISGEITDVDEDTNTFSIESNDVDLWYDRERDITITYSNVNLSVEEGDKVDAGEQIGTSTGHQNCEDFENDTGDTDYIHIRVVLDNSKSVDPRLLIE